MKDTHNSGTPQVSGQESRRAEEREAIINAALPGLVTNEIAADFGGRDEFSRRVPALAPEPLAEKKSFFDQAQPDGTLGVDWRAAAHFALPLIPKGGTVVDLGGSAGQYAKFMALSRSDIKVIAIEPDAEKFHLAKGELKRTGLGNRITLINRPVPAALDQLTADKKEIAAVTSIYRTSSQDDKTNIADMEALKKLNKTSGASVLFLDLHRPRLQSTIKTMTSIYPADDATDHFRKGFADGMKGAYRTSELSGMLKDFVGGQWQNMPAAPMGPVQIQLHIMSGTHVPAPGAVPAPDYPPTKPEYMKLSDTLISVLKAGGVIEQARQALDLDITGQMVRLSGSLRDSFNAMLPTALHFPEAPAVIIPASLQTGSQLKPSASQPKRPVTGHRPD